MQQSLETERQLLLLLLNKMTCLTHLPMHKLQTFLHMLNHPPSNNLLALPTFLVLTLLLNHLWSNRQEQVRSW